MSVTDIKLPRTYSEVVMESHSASPSLPTPVTASFWKSGALPKRRRFNYSADNMDVTSSTLSNNNNRTNEAMDYSSHGMLVRQFLSPPAAASPTMGPVRCPTPHYSNRALLEKCMDREEVSIANGSARDPIRISSKRGFPSTESVSSQTSIDSEDTPPRHHHIARSFTNTDTVSSGNPSIILLSASQGNLNSVKGSERAEIGTPTFPIFSQQAIPTNPWTRCEICQGTIFHQEGACPLRKCSKCQEEGHDQRACYRNMWETPFPHARLPFCPMPSKTCDGRVTVTPQWVLMPISTRILNQLYRMPCPAFSNTSILGVHHHLITYHGVHRYQEVWMHTTTTTPEGETALKIRTAYASSRPHTLPMSPQTLIIPASVCLSLLNTLHSIEHLVLRPWVEDIQRTSPGSALGQSLISWPSISRPGKLNRLSVTLQIEVDGLETDRMVLVELLQDGQPFDPNHCAVRLPWLALAQIRMRMGSIMDQWTLFNPLETSVMRDIRDVRGLTTGGYTTVTTAN